MFGSNLLDVAIGMIFVYLLLSLICSAVHEIIEGWLKNRATDLERGLRELLDPNSQVSQSSIVRSLYNHPLINGLYKGSYDKYVNYKDQIFFVRWLIRIFTRWPTLPSYIPARNFALAMMDTVLPGITPGGAALPAASPPADRASGAAGATPPAAPAAPLVLVTTAGAAPTLSPLAPDVLNTLRNAIIESTTLPEQTKKALLTIVDAATNDPAKARENIENWFNSSMDRVSGWYKRRSQIVILILGFGVAVALNADSVTLVKRLSTDKSLRDSLVAAAETYAKANATSNSNVNANANANTNGNADGNANAKANSNSNGNSNANVKANSNRNVNSNGDANSNSNVNANSNANAKANSNSNANAAPTPAPSASPLPEECQKGNENSPECKIAKNRKEIEKLGLPLGWADPSEDLQGDPHHLKWPGNNWTGEGGWKDQLYWHWLGWLITAMAVSLGAPFWFDLLNKFIVVRSTVKPHEKSPEERSKA